MGVRLPPGGSPEWVAPANGKTFTLAELHTLCECDCIDIRRLDGGRFMVVDDEGLLKELPLNRAASLLYQIWGHSTSPIVGTVVFANAEEID